MGVGNSRRMQPFGTESFLAAKPKWIQRRWFANQLFGQVKTSEVLHDAISGNYHRKDHKKFDHSLRFLPLGHQHERGEKRANQPELAIGSERIQDIKAHEGGEQKRNKKQKQRTVERSCGRSLFAPAIVREKTKKQTKCCLLDGNRQAEREKKEEQECSSQLFLPSLLSSTRMKRCVTF